jgi:hypothetical protein
MMTTTPLQQGQHCQLEDGNDAIATSASMPSRIKDNDTNVTRATLPAQHWQGCLHIDNSNYTIVMRVTIAIGMMEKTPVHQLQQCYHDKGNSASLMTSNKGKNASSTMAETPAHH